MSQINSLYKAVMSRIYLVLLLVTVFLFYDYHQKVVTSYDAKQKVRQTLVYKGSAACKGIFTGAVSFAESLFASEPEIADGVDPDLRISDLPQGIVGTPEVVQDSVLTGDEVIITNTTGNNL